MHVKSKAENILLAGAIYFSHKVLKRYLEPIRTSIMEIFTKIVFAKRAFSH